MTASRVVSWGGIHNSRDLGGLTGRLGTTVFGRLYRMPRLDTLDAAGWAELEAAGVRTIVDLRNAEEIAPLPMRPAGLMAFALPLEDPADAEFMAEWGGVLNSPAVFAEVLRRWPELITNVVSEIADAPEGGVAFHCAAGRDRTGLVAALILELAGVDRTRMIDDYELGVRETNEHLKTIDHREKPRADDDLETHIAVLRAALDEFLTGIDVESYLLSAGVTPEQIDAIRRRLLEP